MNTTIIKNIHTGKIVAKRTVISDIETRLEKEFESSGYTYVNESGQTVYKLSSDGLISTLHTMHSAIVIKLNKTTGNIKIIAENTFHLNTAYWLCLVIGLFFPVLWVFLAIRFFTSKSSLLKSLDTALSLVKEDLTF